MKNIFIGGVAKSGKSRLATKLCMENRLNHIPMDYFASSFKHNFSEVGITSNVIIDAKSSKLLGQFLSRFIEIAEMKDDEFFVIDSAHIMPNDIIKYLDPNKWDIYYLGYPNTTATEKIAEIKKHIQGGWTEKMDDKDLINIFKQLIRISKAIKDECDQNNITFIDTSNEDILKLVPFHIKYKIIKGKNYMKELLTNIDKLHTTEMGMKRIKRNLKLDVDDIVGFCKNKILNPKCNIERQSKNYYCKVDGIRITVNANSYTIITAHVI